MKTNYRRVLILTAFITAVSFTVIAEESLKIPEQLTCIDSEAFENATSISEVIIGSKLKSIESRAFADSSVKLVVFPAESALEYIAPDAFDGTEGVRFIPGGSVVAREYIGTAGIVEYEQETNLPDEDNYKQTIVLPIIPF